MQRRLADVRAASAILGGPATAPVRMLAYGDGRRAVRLAFLSGAAGSGLLQHLPGSSEAIASRCGGSRIDRLDAWLRVGLELGELEMTNGQWAVAGRRARAIAADDAVVAPFYRSVAEYYFGPHLDILDLVGTDAGRHDLSASATTISAVSRVTEHLLAGAIAETLAEVAPATWLEVGCGSGVHLATAMATSPTMRAVAVDLDAAVVDDAACRFSALGVRDRVELRVGDVLDVVKTDERFDVVTLLNNIYYFPEDERGELMDRLASLVRPGGELVVASQCAADSGSRGSIAAAQLDFLLRVQREANASLPTTSQLAELVAGASKISSVEVRRPVPGEPYVIVRGRVATR